MGMAASQARLLSLTSRLHDIEYSAQNIESQKIALATQKDELYKNYCDALDAKKLQVAFMDTSGKKYFVDANFSTVCGYQPDRYQQYSLTDARSGKIIVDEKVAKLFEEEDFTDKYSFAWAAIGLDDGFAAGTQNGNTDHTVSCTEATDSAADGLYSKDQLITFDGITYMVMTGSEAAALENYEKTDTKLSDAWDELQEFNDPSEGEELTKADFQKAYTNFRELLYKELASKIFEQQNKDYNANADERDESKLMTGTWDTYKNEFNYYVALFEQIQAAGGCTSIENQYVSGEEGNEWFNNMVNAGLIIISEFNTDTNEWNATNAATCTNGNYIQKVSDDTDLKKVEAEYEYELDRINSKDSKYDTELSKLETERTAITTEIDSIGKVKDENIERTFGVFS